MGIFLPSYSRSYTPRPAYRTPYKSAKSAPAFMFKAEDVWSAAAAATRINSGYVKEAQYRYDQDTNSQILVKEANKVMVRNLLEAPQGWMEEDVAVGAEARAYWQNNLVKMIGGTANDFEQTAIALANKEQIETNYDLAVISSLIASAQRGRAKEALIEVKSNTDSKHVGTVGNHFTLHNAEVIAVGNLSDFGKYRVDAKFEGNLFSWWSSKSYAVGSAISVKGKIKGHTKDRDTNTAITQLNYVKNI